MAGATIVENAPVERIDVVDGRITGVVTAGGRIDCEIVVLCAGQWTRQLAATVGVAVPLVSVEHQYVITEPMDVPRDLPTLRDPDRLTYYKEEVGGLVMGGYEPNPKPWVTRVPDDFTFQLLDADWDHFAPIMELAIGRVPRLGEVGINQLVNGPESFTPDGMFILGEAPELRNCFVGAGFNAFGIAAGGGAGMALAEWIVNGAPPYDLWNADIRRFGRPHRSTRMGSHPHARGLRQALHDGLAVRGARQRPAVPSLAACTTACWPPEPASARSWVGSARTGSPTPPPASRRTIEYSYGRQNWFVRRGTRAPGDPRGGGADRPDVVRQVRPERAGRGRRPRLDLRQRRRQAGGVTHVHADARPPRRHPVRPHRRPRGGGRVH